MPDNVAITPGTGATVAADDVGGVHYQRIKVAFGADGAAADVNTGTGFPVTAQAAEAHMGEVGGNTAIVALTFSLDTVAYASGDVLAATQELASAMRVNDGKGILQSIILNGKDDQGAALDLVFFDANVALGTENAAPSITDGDADNILGIVSVSAADWIDLGGTRVATLRNVGLPVKAVSGGTSIYVAAITRGTPTHTASGMTARFGFLRD